MKKKSTSFLSQIIKRSNTRKFRKRSHSAPSLTVPKRVPYQELLSSFCHPSKSDENVSSQKQSTGSKANNSGHGTAECRHAS